MGLMGVELLNAFVAIRRDKLRADLFRHWRPLRLSGRNSVQSGDEFAIPVTCGQLIDNGLDLAC